MLPSLVQVLLRSIFFVMVAWHFLLPEAGHRDMRQVSDHADRPSDTNTSD